jgi:hypothetical protein
MPVFQMPGAYMFIRALDRLLIELNGISEYQLEPALGDRILARQVINNRTKRYDCLLQVCGWVGENIDIWFSKIIIK